MWQKLKQVDKVGIALGLVTSLAFLVLLLAPVYLTQVSESTGEKIRAWVPAVSAVWAFLSVLVAAWVFNRGVIERRRERTIAAWREHTKATDPLIRRELTTEDGQPAPVSEEEVRDLLLLRRRTEASAVNDVELAQIKRIHALADILNSIERLGVGCDHRLYDRAFLSRLARSRILGVIDRLDALVTASRARQPTAFASLERMRKYLNSQKAA